MLLKLKQTDFLITVLVGDERYDIDMRSQLNVNQDKLSDELATQASWYAWFSALLSTQEAVVAEKRHALERYKADLAGQIRQGKISYKNEKGEKVKLTEGGINDKVLSDERYCAYQEEFEEAEKLCKKLKSLTIASAHRKDMLIQLALLKRSEMSQLNLSVKE